MGGAEGYKVEMDRIIRRKILSAFISQPRLLLNKEVCDKIIVRFKKVLKINPFVKLHIMIANKIKNPNEEVSSNKVVLSEPILRLTGIAVEKNDSNQGIGKKLIMEFERLGEIQKYKSIIVETSNQNIRAIEFYKRRGYKKCFYEGSNSNKAIFYKDLYSKNGVEGFEINFNHTEK